MTRKNRSLLIENARDLYSEGTSVRDIGSMIGVPYSTVGGWVRGTPLSETGSQRVEERLSQKLAKARAAAAVTHRKARSVRVERDRQISLTARSEVLNDPSEAEIKALFVGIYMGEGDKTAMPYRVAVANSDPSIIRLCLRVFRDLGVPEDRFRLYLQVHCIEYREEAIRFWSEACGLPVDRFRVYILCSSTSKHISPKRIPHGVLKLTVHDVRLAARISGWLEAARELASQT